MQQTNNHTWYESKTGNHQGLVIDEKTGANIAVTYDKAHAALIASAPELLAALEDIEGALHTLRAAGIIDGRLLIDKARYAINKAKGDA